MFTAEWGRAFINPHDREMMGPTLFPEMGGQSAVSMSVPNSGEVIGDTFRQRSPGFSNVTFLAVETRNEIDSVCRRTGKTAMDGVADGGKVVAEEVRKVGVGASRTRQSVTGYHARRPAGGEVQEGEDPCFCVADEGTRMSLALPDLADCAERRLEGGATGAVGSEPQDFAK